MFEELYAPLPDRKGYLERIGAHAPDATDKNALDRADPGAPDRRAV